MTPPTYAEARAACVARYGREPDDEYAISACARSWWGFDEAGDAGVVLRSFNAG